MGALTSKPYAFLARSWELKSVETLDPFDSYLSKIRIDYRGDSILRILPSINEFGNQEWISDKIRFFYDAIHYQRISTPWLKESLVINYLLSNGYLFSKSVGSSGSFSVSWVYALECVFTVFRSFSNLALSRNLPTVLPIHTFLSSTSDLIESSHLKNFANESGSNFNSTATFSSFGRFSDFRSEFSLNLSELGRSDACILVSLNLRLESPLLNLSFRQLVLQEKLTVYSFFFSYYSNYTIINLGLTAKNFFSFFSGKHETCVLFEKFNTPSILFGSSFFQVFDFSLRFFSNYLYDSNFYSKAKFQLYYLPVFSSIISSLELGFDSEMSKFNISSRDGVHILISLGSEAVDFSLYEKSIDNLLFPIINSDQPQQPTVFSIYIGSHGDINASTSHATFPASLPVEKSNLYLSLEGKPNLGKVAVLPFLPLVRTSYSILNRLLPLIKEGLNLVDGFNFSRGESLIDGFKNEQIFFTESFIYSMIYEKDTFCQSFVNEYFLTDPITRSSQNLALSSAFRSVRISNFN